VLRRPKARCLVFRLVRSDHPLVAGLHVGSGEPQAPVQFSLTALISASGGDPWHHKVPTSTFDGLMNLSSTVVAMGKDRSSTASL